MSAYWSGRATDFLAMPAGELLERLNLRQSESGFDSRHEQLLSWRTEIRLLRAALELLDDPENWRLVLEYSMIRLGRRIDALLLHPRAIFVLEFKDKHGVELSDRRQVEDYALDLRDFHAASRIVPIIPMLVANTHRSTPVTQPMLFNGCASDVVSLAGNDLGATLRDLLQLAPASGALDVDAWEDAPYRPVPPIVDAARTMYARHGVEEIRSARADARNLTTTIDAINKAITRHREGARRVIVFVTGIPGAGKTLCGLDVAFARGGSFLTGNPSLVHVFREALARDIARGPATSKRAADRLMEGAIQQLPWFRTRYVSKPAEHPSETIVVVDEAQRCWSEEHARRKTAKKPLQLEHSEPAYLLDIMARHPDPVTMICLIGNGQEIHTGEGGLAEWGAALRQRPDWTVFASPATQQAAEPRQRLPELAGMILDPALHLTVATRSIINQRATEWVEAVLRSDTTSARAIAAAADTTLPFFVTRSLADMRGWLRESSRGNRRCGLVGSSGAARLRAEGLGAELPHMDANAVARWFLDRWPEDVRASDALEQVATEFSCQGLELDYVGLCWGGDFLRAATGWLPRRFAGTKWQRLHHADAAEYRRNSYRVLLTRARYATVIWVPEGDACDKTRDPEQMNDIAAYLRRCGAGDLHEIRARTTGTDAAEMRGQMVML